MKKRKSFNKNNISVIKHLIENTDLFIYQIANLLNLSVKSVGDYYRKNYTSSFRKRRNNKQYSKTKIGKLNPMYGKTGKDHPNYIGDVSDNKGYIITVKPKWYTGRKGSYHVFKHSVVVCENLGLAEVPKGYCVHHCDLNPLNNDFDNLVLMSIADHAALHSTLKGATTISKESTLKWVETRKALKAKI